MASKAPAPVESEHVAEGIRLRAEAAEIKADCDAIALRLKGKNAELDAVNAKLVALGAGRYCDAENRFACTVVGEVAATMSPDRFELRSADDEAKARELAGDDFRRLFDRHEYWTPKDDFRGLVKGRLTPKKQEAMLALTIIPGNPEGGRTAHVRWPSSTGSISETLSTPIAGASAI